MRGCGTISSRASPGAEPTIAASGALASPAIASGTSTSGLLDRCRCRTVATGWATPEATACAAANARNVLMPALRCAACRHEASQH
ncbi:hypothetical protein Vwe01_34020 [Micromonospora andamanensis]|nr:hypothetical protein Vwe01_34020 [Micromonospora andamanensis]